MTDEIDFSIPFGRPEIDGEDVVRRIDFTVMPIYK